MTTATEYKKGDFVLVQIRQHEMVQVYDGKPPRIGNVLRLATADEASAYQAEKERRLTQAREYQQRIAKQDWQDATFVAGMLDNERENSIAILGAELIAEIADKLRNPQKKAAVASQGTRQVKERV